MRYGSDFNPPNRFQTVRLEADLDHMAWDDEYLRDEGRVEIEYLTDDSRTIVSENNSPDIPFRYSLNPYRGCIHGCSYCYARPTHEYLSLSAGRDFETRIVVKLDAARLFREFLAQPAWKPEPIMFSGVTDCYQPAERHFRLTRACLDVALECHLPIRIVTKNALVTRDLDQLASMAERSQVHVLVSITTLDRRLAREFEPRTSTPEARLRAIRMLSDAGVPTGVMVAPVIPGLNDESLPEVLDAARSAGAKAANFTLVRLPRTVGPIFEAWLQRVMPDKAGKILGRIRAIHGGKLNETAWGRRMSGSGPLAEQIRNLFRLCARRQGLDANLPPLDANSFRPPPDASGQPWLF